MPPFITALILEILLNNNEKKYIFIEFLRTTYSIR